MSEKKSLWQKIKSMLSGVLVDGTARMVVFHPTILLPSVSQTPGLLPGLYQTSLDGGLELHVGLRHVAFQSTTRSRIFRASGRKVRLVTPVCPIGKDRVVYPVVGGVRTIDFNGPYTHVS